MRKHSLAEYNVIAIDKVGRANEVVTTTMDDSLDSVGENNVDVLSMNAEGA